MKWRLEESLQQDGATLRRHLMHFEFGTPYEAFDQLRTMFYTLRMAGMQVEISGTGAEPNATMHLPKGAVIWTMKEAL